MTSWNDAAVHNGASFNPSSGGSMLDHYPSSFDPTQFQAQQLQQRMQNGAMRNGSPSFNNPVYQTNQVIPSKRPRPREESMATSPRQAPGMQPNSRSQTPSFAPQQQNPYTHLQNGSANASPSPIMANQLRPGGVPQRVSTASPHPFSPAAQQFGGQGSPSQSDHGNRTDTPQNHYTQNPAFTPGFAQNFTPPPGRTSAPPQPPMSTPQMAQPHMQSQMFNQPPQQGQMPRPQTGLEQQKMLYQMRLQQQMQASQARNMSPNVNPMAAQMQGPNGQLPNMRAQQGPHVPRPANPDQFVKNLSAFMQSKQMPLDMNPIVGDRPINIVMLYMAVSKFGGYRKVTQQNGWAQVAQAMSFSPLQNPNAAAQIKNHYERNLLAFEEAWTSQQQRQRAAMIQGQGGGMGGGQGPQMSPTKHMNQSQMQQSPQYMQQMQQEQARRIAQQQHLAQQQAQNTPVKQMGPAMQPAINGFSTPQGPQPQHPIGPQGHGRNSLSRSIESTPPQNGTAFTMPSPASAIKPGSISMPSPHEDPALKAGAPQAPVDFNLPAELNPKIRVLDTFGGIELNSLLKLGAQLTQYKPDVPAVADLGAIDIHALTMSLQSGIHAEVRLALDTLVSISVETRLQFDLRACEDLIESLIDCAEVQVELLAENAAEVSDVMLITSYEDVVRGCRSEKDTLQDIPAFGTLEYDLDRAVDRLICITTIMRNLSFSDLNQGPLADELVVKFFSVVIRYLGTRNMLLRTHSNTLDFMKDIVIYLSNVAHAVELPGREQALCLLHFVLAFAPSPAPNSFPGSSDGVSFAPYDPPVHRYLPAAVDSLAKLLARDEPNRTHYKTIFASDVASSPPYDLLTRTFALAISPIPDLKQDNKRGVALVVEHRKPYLMQGMLAAEILSNMVPGYESGIPKSWLTSDDGWSQNLTQLILKLCLETTTQAPHGRGQAPPPKGVEDEALLHIALGGIAVLRKLAEKSRDPEDPSSFIPYTGLPSKESLLGTLRIVQPRLQVVLKQLCAYAGLDT